MAPETEACEALIRALETCYAEEKFPVKFDKLHGSLGDKGTVIGVYANDTGHTSRQALVGQIDLVIQFYGKYKKEVNREQTVDPRKIYEYAERFRQVLKVSDPRSPGVWYFMLERTRYPDDPTGNKTRYEMAVRAYGNNTALVESTG